jgi:hypothetical protein
MKPSHIFIIGTHRSGSTSVFRYLQGHDEVLGCFKKELHYFTSGIYSSEFHFDQKEYEAHFPKKNGIFLEASPSYFYGGRRLAEFLKDCLTRPKAILILRNPTDRFFSFLGHHNVHLHPQKRPDTGTFIRESQAEYESGKLVDNAINRGLREGVYADYLTGWIEVFDKDLKIISFDRLVEDHLAVIDECLGFLALDPLKITVDENSVHNQTRDSHNFILHKFAMSVNRSLEYFFRKNPRIKERIKRVYGKFNEKKSKPEFSREHRQQVAAFYKPHNARLRHILEENGLSIPEWALT